jgi:hypothetical protein
MTEIRTHYKVTGPLAFVHVHLLDNRSEFVAPLRLSLRPVGENFVVAIRAAVAIANSIASLSELIEPKTIFLELTPPQPYDAIPPLFVLGRRRDRFARLLYPGPLLGVGPS